MRIAAIDSWRSKMLTYEITAPPDQEHTTMKTQAVTFSNTDEVALQTSELEVSKLGPNQILLATEYSVVSAGTELAIWGGTEDWARLPYVPGYGAVGIVQKVGTSVKRCVPGDRIFCYGRHASFSVYEVGMVVKDPADLEPRQAVLARMGQVAFTSVRVGGMELGDVVAVTGLGLVGNFASQLLKLAGCTVIGIDISERRLAIAKSCGIDHAINTKHEDPLQAVKRITCGALCNAVVEATGVPDMAATATRLVQRGTVVLLGTPRGNFTLNTTDVLRDVHLAHRQITMKGGHEWVLPLYPETGSKHSLARNVEQLFEFMKSGRLNTTALVSHCVPPTGCREVYTNLRNRNEDYFGVVFDWKSIA
jgi:threonine dehydrogenase-like Zn-dependent dehydrogenase